MDRLEPEYPWCMRPSGLRVAKVGSRCVLGLRQHLGACRLNLGGEGENLPGDVAPTKPLQELSRFPRAPDRAQPFVGARPSHGRHPHYLSNGLSSTQAETGLGRPERVGDRATLH